MPGASTRENRSLRLALQQIDAIHLDFVFIEIGNDLCDESVKPRRIARDIVSFARFVSVGYETKCVVVDTILQRMGLRSLSHNERVAATNKYLSELVMAEPGMHYWCIGDIPAASSTPSGLTLTHHMVCLNMGAVSGRLLYFSILNPNSVCKLLCDLQLMNLHKVFWVGASAKCDGFISPHLAFVPFF